MIYKQHLITASAPSYQYHEVNEDGTIGSFIDEGGCSGDWEFDIKSLDENGEEDELLDGGYTTLEEAKNSINEIVKRATTFQSVAGN